MYFLPGRQKKEGASCHPNSLRQSPLPGSSQATIQPLHPSQDRHDHPRSDARYDHLHPAADPPHHVADVAIPAGAVMAASALWRNSDYTTFKYLPV